MAYQNISIPRFFVDHLLWLKTLGMEYYTAGGGGILSDRLDLISLNPAQSHLINYAGSTPPDIYTDYVVAPPIMTSDNKWKAYIAILGHNSTSAQASLRFVTDDATHIYPDNYVNFTDDTSSPYNGFTIGYDFDGTGDNFLRFGFDPVADSYEEDFNIGCISHGNYYDMTNAPNLSLTMSREYGGIKEFTTNNGSSMSNSMQDKPPKWGNLGAWELLKIEVDEPEPDIILGDINADGGINVLDVVALVNIILSEGSAEDFPAGDLNQDENINILDIVALITIILNPPEPPEIVIPYPQALSRSSRRTWDLKFSYIGDDSLWGSNQMLSQHFDISSNTGYDLSDLGTYDSYTNVPSFNNGNFEGSFNSADGVNGVIAESWDRFAGSGDLFAEENSEVQEGGKAQKLTRLTNTSQIGVKGAFDTVEGVIYKITGWVYVSNGNQIRLKMDSFSESYFIEHTESTDMGAYIEGGEALYYPSEVIESNAWNYVVGYIQGGETTDDKVRIYQNSGFSSINDYLIFDNFSIVTISLKDGFTNTLLTDDNFFSQVWHKTLGGTLPFIFQPDNSNNNPDQFAIAKFDPNSLKATQSAHNVYDISLKIEEVW